MPYRAIISAWISAAFILYAAHDGSAQDRASLEARRSQLLNQIATNTALLEEARKGQKATIGQLEQLNAELEIRREIIGSYKTEIEILTRQLDAGEKNLAQLRKEMTSLEDRYLEQMKQAYFERRLEVRALDLLSAQNINQAFARWRYYQMIARNRQMTYRQLEQTRDSIEIQVNRISTNRSQKQAAAEKIIAQEKELISASKETERVFNSLKRREKELSSEIDRQKRERERLDAEIARIVAAEIDNTALDDAGLPTAPALKALNAEFRSNRGKLPWPVDRGIVTGKFGTQPHPLVPSIQVSNNGIDITTTGNSPVKAIFAGDVVGIKTIPGFDYTVIIRHGTYYSVYSRLAEVRVEIGDKVRTGAVLGKVPGSASGQNPKLHLEIWQNKTQVDPQLWISG